MKRTDPLLLGDILESIEEILDAPLAQAFSALYPSHSNEKRWVDGVPARKKGLGF